MCGPAGERQPEQPGDLVERLPRGVVDGGAERLDPPRAVTSLTRSSDEWPPLTSSARHGLGQRAVLELVDGDVRGEVVDAVERLAEPDGERLGRGDPDQQRAGQPGAAR